jgi:hypothetical protein
VPRWLAFRWLFAQAYNAHQPQKSQARTKQHAGQVAAAIVEGMGGSIMAPPPPGLDEDAEWQAFVDAARVLDYGQCSSLMALVMAQQWPDLLRPGCCTAPWNSTRTRLALLLCDLQVQQRANDAGWIEGVGYPKKGRKGGNRRGKKR